MTDREAREYGEYIARQERKHILRRKAALGRRFGDDADYTTIEAALHRNQEWLRWLRRATRPPTP